MFGTGRLEPSSDVRGGLTCLSGGAGGVRTRDLIDAIDARSQLRYGPTLVIRVVNFIASWRESVKRWQHDDCGNLSDQ
jgi:hypothetical protein